MASEWIDLVIVRHNMREKAIYLFEAPAWSGLEKGDIVKCQTSSGLVDGFVVHKESVEINNKEAIETWCNICGAKVPLKRLEGKFNKFVYSDEQEPEESEDNNGNQL